MTTHPDPLPLTLWLGRLRASTIDAAAVLADVCAALPEALGVAGAAVLVVDVHDPLGLLVASGDESRWLGEVQRRAGRGPLVDALCTGRTLATADLGNVGLPALGAAATQSGLVSSLALPIEVDGERMGALQLLGDSARPVGPAHTELVGPLLRVLAARLADVHALRLARTPASRPMPPPAPAPAPAAPAAAPAAAVEPPTAEPASVEPHTVPFATPIPAPRPAPAPAAVRRPAPRPRPTPDDASEVHTAGLPIISAGVAARLGRGRHASDTLTAMQQVVPATARTQEDTRA